MGLYETTASTQLNVLWHILISSYFDEFPCIFQPDHHDGSISNLPGDLANQLSVTVHQPRLIKQLHSCSLPSPSTAAHLTLCHDTAPKTQQPWDLTAMLPAALIPDHSVSSAQRTLQRAEAVHHHDPNGGDLQEYCQSFPMKLILGSVFWVDKQTELSPSLKI